MSALKWLQPIDEIVNSVAHAPWEDEEFYRVYISQIYHFVCHSTRMLAAAAAVTESPGYYRRLIDHIKEENGHEKLALHDLQNAGGTIDQYPELGITRALWEPQFFKIQRNPSALLGYIIALEVVAVRAYPELMERLEKRYGKKAVTFIRVHGMEDPDHVDKAVEQIGMLPEAEQKLVRMNFEQTCSVLRCFMRDVRESAEQRSAGAHKRTRAA